MYIRARSKWTKIPPRKPHVEWAGRIVPVRIHHTAGAGPRGQSNATIQQEIDRLRQLDSDAKRRGYITIPYSYVIMPSGNVWEGRGFEILGGHTEGHNRDIGVAFDGNYEKKHPTKAQLEAYFALRRKLHEHDVTPGESIPHCRTSQTLCCGKFLIADLHLRR